MSISPAPKKWIINIGATVEQLTLPQLRELHNKLGQLLHAEAHFAPHIRLVARKFRITPQRILSKNRCDEVCRARWAAMWLMRRDGVSYSEIARTLHIDDSTVRYGLSVLATRMECNKELASIMHWLKEQAA